MVESTPKCHLEDFMDLFYDRNNHEQQGWREVSFKERPKLVTCTRPLLYFISTPPTRPCQGEQVLLGGNCLHEEMWGIRIRKFL